MAEKIQLENMTITDQDSTVPLRDVNNKRTTYLDWDEYFMATAFLAAMRSKDPVTQIGACIVNEDKKIVAVGYNGMPTGCHDDAFPWRQEYEDQRDSKFLYMCHAELNAILNKNASNVENCSLYVGLFPCNECAKAIIQSGIRKVFYISDKYNDKETTKIAKRLFDTANIEYSQCQLKNKRIIIDFSEIDLNCSTQLPPTPPKHKTIEVTPNDIPASSSIEPFTDSQICHLEQKSCNNLNHEPSIYLDWDEYFMAMAFLAAMRSKDPVTQVGACIVDNDRKIVAIGYNGMPTGCHDDEFPWGKESKDQHNNKFLYVCHAELNAILNKNATNVNNCSIYVGLFPCNECAKAIIQSGIRKVFYISDKHSHKVTTIASKRMFDASQVEYSPYEPKNREIILNFSKIDKNYINQLSSTPPKNVKIDMNSKRLHYLDWDEYFMATAFLAAMRSKDPVNQVGACIVNEKKRIVGVGYNGMPNGCHDQDFPWKEEGEIQSDTKYPYVCHAELNAILNKNASNIQNCTLYVGLFPCNKCAQAIIQSGIKKIVYISDSHSHTEEIIAAKRMFDAVKVGYGKYEPKNVQIVINFSEINWNYMTQLPPTPAKNKGL